MTKIYFLLILCGQHDLMGAVFHTVLLLKLRLMEQPLCELLCSMAESRSETKSYMGPLTRPPGWDTCLFCTPCIEVKWTESRSVVSNSLQPHELYSPWNSPGQNTGVGSLSLLQWIFPTQGSNPGCCIAGGFFTNWTTREAPPCISSSKSWDHILYKGDKQGQPGFMLRNTIGNISWLSLMTTAIKRCANKWILLGLQVHSNLALCYWIRFWNWVIVSLWPHWMDCILQLRNKQSYHSSPLFNKEGGWGEREKGREKLLLVASQVQFESQQATFFYS